MHLFRKSGGCELLEEARVRTTPAAPSCRFGTQEFARVVLEAGTHSPWVSRLLTELGHEVIVAHPGRLSLIYENHSKSDRVDARRCDRILLAAASRLPPRELWRSFPVSPQSSFAASDISCESSRSSESLQQGTTTSFTLEALSGGTAFDPRLVQRRRSGVLTGTFLPISGINRTRCTPQGQVNSLLDI